MSEAAIVAAIRRELHRRGAWEIKTHGAGAGRRGIPDIIACHRGAFLAIEAKAPGRVSTLTALQEYELDRIRAAGGLAILATGGETVRGALDEIEKQTAERVAA